MPPLQKTPKKKYNIRAGKNKKSTLKLKKKKSHYSLKEPAKSPQFSSFLISPNSTPIRDSSPLPSFFEIEIKTELLNTPTCNELDDYMDMYYNGLLDWKTNKN